MAQTMRSASTEGMETPEFDIGVAVRPLFGEPVAGDATSIVRAGRRLAVALADGLGHGPEARASADRALHALNSRVFDSLQEGLQAAHQAVRGRRRGAVLAVARFDADASNVTFAGVGNIDLIVLDGAVRRLVARHGMLGGNLPRIIVESVPFDPGSLALMCSDGIAIGTDHDRYAGLDGLSAQALAEAIVREAGRDSDDATAVVVRRRRT
jgi:serine/threonine protein phosphatase PrpC